MLPAELEALHANFKTCSFPIGKAWPELSSIWCGTSRLAGRSTADPASATANNNLLTSSWQGQGICLAVLICKKRHTDSSVRRPGWGEETDYTRGTHQKEEQER